MARWQILDLDSPGQRSVAPLGKDQPQKGVGDDASLGLGTEKIHETSSVNPPEVRDQPSVSRTSIRRTSRKCLDRTYSLRAAELEAMTDMGRFRTLDAQDLTRFVYYEDVARMDKDLRNLKEQGLVEEKTLYGAHREPRRIVTLTPVGHQVVRRVGSIPKEQRLYHGFVKTREINHDADLYKVYQKAIEEIRRTGGKAVKVTLDFELKAAIQRQKQGARKLPENQRAKWMKAVAEQHGLRIQGTKITVPDIQVEYETFDGDRARTNLELVSENYRGEAIRGKSAAGFKVYARVGDENRVRRALHDTGKVQEILSI